MTDDDEPAELSLSDLYDAIESVGRPHLTAAEVSRKTDLTTEEAREELERLADIDEVARQDVTSADAVWYPTDLDAVTDRERVVLFPDRREVVVQHADQFTRAQLSQFAHLVDTNRSGGAIYEMREEDVWQAPYDSLEDLIATMRDVFGERSPHLEEWVTSQWERARKFRLYTHEDGYTVLAAESDDLMGNVARQKLDDECLRAPISDSESWVNEDETAQVKRTLYDAGYPVRDERDLDEGEDLDLELRLQLRDYQADWVQRFVEQGSGVFVGPPGSGKTVAAMGAMEAVGGETLILVPSRELASQWHDELVLHTDLEESHIGEYHGGTKAIRPVTIATYRTAGMDRHRKLFDERRWGLIVYDECLTGDTVIETLDGRKTFAELDAEYGFEEGWTTDVDITVQSFDQNSGEYVMSDVSGVYKTQAPVERIETNTGDVLTATPGHTHLVFDPETGSIDDQAGVEEGTYLVQPSPGVDVDVDRNPVSMSDEAVRAELLGWFIGDGHYDSHRHITFSFGRNAEEQIRIISRLCDQIGVSYTTFANTRGDITLVSTDLDSELPWSGDTGRKVESIRVPADSYRWDHDARAALLRGLFDAEGSVDKKGRIQFNTVSGGLADDVSNLMQKMGILTRRMRRERIEQDYSDVHRLNIPSFYGEAFSRAVGFRLEHKSERVSTGESPATGLPIGPLLASLKEKLGLTNDDLAEMADVSRQTIGGVIRGEHNLGKPAIDELGDGLESYADTEISDPAAARKSFGVTYERLSDEIGCTEGGSHSKLQRSSETAIRALSTILEERRETATEFAQRLKTVTNLTVVEVIDKEHVGQEVVYDFETETHTFLADGFLTHNCHHIPSPVYSLSADLQGKHRLGLTATPTRESDDEEEIFTLVGPPIGTDWSALFEAGFVQEPEVNIRLVPWGDDAEADEYVSAVGHGRRQAAADNSAKIDEIRFLLEEHPAAKALIFVEYLDQGEAIADALDLPFISGEMPHARREKLFDEFRMGQRDALVVSRVGDEGIDLPDAELAIIASGLGGSRRQGAQRAGRTMRPVGDAVLYVLATRGTEEEDFVRRQMRHLASKGIRVTESESEVGDVRESTLEEPPSSDSGESGSVD